MKKTSLVLLILCFVFLTGCTNYGKKFSKKEVFDVEIILAKEEVYDDIVAAINHYNDTDKKTINFKSATNGLVLLAGVNSSTKTSSLYKLTCIKFL